MKRATATDEITRKLIDAATDAIAILDVRGHIRHLSPGAEALFGVDITDCRDDHFSTLLAADDRSDAIDLFLRQQEDHVPLYGIGYEAKARTRQGYEFPVALEIGETRLQDERRLICVCRDLSEARQSAAKKRSAESLNQALFEAAVDGIITIDARGLIQAFNPAAESLFGFRRSEVLGQNVSILMPDHYARHHDDYLDNYLHTGEARIIGIGRDVVGQRKDGARFPLHLSVGEAGYGDDRHFIGICHDLSDYHEALRKLALAEKRYKDIVHAQSQMICRVDTDLNITFANRSLMQCLGRSHQELVGTPLHHFVADNEAAIRDLLTKLFSSTGARHVKVKVTMASASRNPQVEWTFTRPDNGNDEGSELQGFGVDISEMVQARREAEYFRNYDTVTGLYNKPAFLRELDDWAAEKPAFSMIHMDLDNFGLVNQKYSFETGNLVLNEVAHRLLAVAGYDGLLARIGADDFLLAMPISQPVEVEDLTRKLSSDIGRDLPANDETLSIDVAIGVAFYPGDSTEIQRLPELAESAMKDARARQQPIALFNQYSHTQLQRRLDIDQALKRAIEEQVPHLFLQPKYTVASQHIAGFEALIRWNDPILGPISPAEFIPLVEHSKLGQKLDQYVIRKAIAAIREVSASTDLQLPIAVNITPPHFSNPGLAGFILGQLEKSDVSPHLLEVELTEGVFLQPNANVASNLSTLRKAGVRVAIDDFGTGYSSLSYLKNLQVDELKIDQSFTRDLNTETGRTVLQAVILIARAFDLRMTAEGVETAEQLQILDGLDCNLAQGFYLAKPMAVSETCRMLLD